MERKMANESVPGYSVIKLESGWFWSSHSMKEVGGRDPLIGPFPSQEETEKDAKATLGVQERE
jgi:hypothetical protein